MASRAKARSIGLKSVGRQVEQDRTCGLVAFLQYLPITKGILRGKK
jgi:hypothetical protein